MDLFLAVFLAVIGAVVGSFLNVCIWRIPRGESIVFPASHCPKCGTPIRFLDNIPIVSYLILAGKCRRCGEKISPRYPLVEALTAALSFLLFLKFGFTLQYLCAFVFTVALIAVTFIDLEHQIIPDVISLPGIPLFLILAVGFMDLSLLDSVLGLFIGGGFLFIIALGYEFLTKREGMGGGDIKLLAMMGAFLGWQSLFFIVFLSSILGSLVGITLILTKGRDMKYAVPFGPFLSVAAVTYLFTGKEMMFLWLYRGLS